MINKYLDDYLLQIDAALSYVDIDNVYTVLKLAADLNYPVFVFGNGGSCAIAEHLSCDFLKGIAHDSPVAFPRVQSLVSNQSLITAIANDYGYQDIFAKQLEYAIEPQALVIAISSSGNSENIIRGLRAAALKNYVRIALVGFDGGRVVSEGLANGGCTVHVKSANYGVIEDCHQIIMHSLAQQLRLDLSSEPLKIKL